MKFTGAGFKLITNGFEISLPNGVTVVGKIPKNLTNMSTTAEYVRSADIPIKSETMYINIFDINGFDITTKILPNSNVITPLQLSEVLFTVSSLKYF